MRLLIHAAGIAGGGGMRHLAGFLPALGEALEGRGRAFVVVRRSVSRALPALRDVIELVEVPDVPASSPPARLALDNLWIPRLSRRLHVDLIVSLANFGPLAVPVPHVVFQTNALYFDREVYRRASWNERLDLRLRRHAARFAMMGARLVVTPSEAMATSVRATLPPGGPEVVRLRHGIEGAQFQQDGRARKSGERFRFVCPAVTPAYKGLDVLMPALRFLEPGTFVLRAFGGLSHWPAGVREALRSADAMGLSSSVTIEEEVPPSTMPSVYAWADAMIYPTLCESFGFSLLEAMASGLPVIASDIPVNREVAGDAAHYYEPRSSRALGSALREVLEDTTLHAELSRRGRARLDAFDWSWTRYATEFISICERVR